VTEVKTIQGNPIIILGDKIARKNHLISFIKNLRTENALLKNEQQIKYAVCEQTIDVALSLKLHGEDAKMILLGPGLAGKADTIARMLSSKTHIILIIDPTVNPLGTNPTDYKRNQSNLEELGIIISLAKNANEEFYAPLVRKYVLSDMPPNIDPDEISAEDRSAIVDKRLDAINTFPALPETHRKVAQLEDLDPPKKWAEAIEPDVPTKTVILKHLNSAHYGFRTRVEAIDQAVALASTKTIREIVSACQIRQIFKKTDEKTIEQFWRHALSVAYYAKVFSLPASSEDQDAQQKSEFKRLQLEENQVNVLLDTKLWQKFDLSEQDDAFMAGLLHDIGKVTMLMCLEDSLPLITALIESEVQEAQNQGHLWAKEVLEIERFLMKDIDHQIIGHRIAEKWELDESIKEVIATHHKITENSADLIKLIGLANAASNCMFPYPATESQHPFPQLFARIEKSVTKSTKKGAEAVEEAINEEIFEDLTDVVARMEMPKVLWDLIDYKTFFKTTYMVSNKIKSLTIGFLQQTR
tara:strand:+ start:907 stop:2487 length:1581 start_codon:yes stop_codon:yes gene_type:complete